MTKARIWVLLCTALICFFVEHASAQEKNCAVVLLHGKWGTPQSIGFFGNKLEPWCDSKAIDLPWSKRRGYDAPYPDALKQISDQVDLFRVQGYKHVLLAGHSFGSNAALAYMAQIGNVDGVIALAPGHVPEKMYQRGIGKEAVDKARELVLGGRGDETLTMDDLNQGKQKSIRMTAQVLLSYFDPNGLGNMPSTTAHFKKAVPLLWVVGTKDPLYSSGADFAFNSALPHLSSKYLVVDADHEGTPEAAVSQVNEWIKGLR